MAGLYIHIPFCAGRCAYCDFYSTDGNGRGELLSAYPEALLREMESRSRLSTFDFPLSTIYVGGGTPSQLSPERLQGLLDKAAELWDCSGLREVTLEANPEDLTDDCLARLSGTGFNRISVGIQSFDDVLLRLMNRRHDAARAKNAVRAAQRVGFGNISIDLIFGIPGITRAQWERTLDEAVGLGAQHISAYHLTIEPATLFGKMAQRDEGNKSPSAFRPVPEAESEWQYETLRRKLGDAGFEHYEISNFAPPGFRAVHNSAYWSGEPYLGVGPSAHSYGGARRREWVLPDIEKYIAAFTSLRGAAGDEAIRCFDGRIVSGKRPRNDYPGALYESETLSDTELFNERIMTSLRTAEGVKSEELRFKSGKNTEKLLSDGLLVNRGGHIAIPPEKFLLSDYIISSLFVTEI